MDLALNQPLQDTYKAKLGSLEKDLKDLSAFFLQEYVSSLK